MGDEEAIGPGAQGAGAGREPQWRRARREGLTRERQPRIGRLLRALRRQDERSGSTGGEGEAIVAGVLARRCRHRVVLLHDRRIPGRRSTINHIAVARSGVWVVGAERCTGRVQICQARLAVVGRDRTRLFVSGRDKTTLVDGLSMQVGLVAAAVAEVDPTIGVHGALCFVAPQGRLTSTSIPVLRRLRIRDYALLRPHTLARRLNRGGELSQEQMTSIASMLARRFPVA
jgi:hypothetical protein